MTEDIHGNGNHHHRRGNGGAAPSAKQDAAVEVSEYLRTLLENIHDLVVLTTEAGVPIYANPAWQRRFGDPMVSSDPFTRIHPDDADRVDAAWQDMLDGRRDFSDVQYRITTPDGESRVFESTAREVGGGERLFLVMTHEVTPRVLAESALKDSEEKYRLIFDNASDAIFIAQDDTIQFPNPATRAAIGYSAEELKRVRLSELIHPDDREDIIRRHRIRMQGRQPPPPQPYRVIRKGGQVVWVEPRAVTIQWEGRPASLNFLTDITSRMIIKERLEQSQRLEAIGTLAGGIAHDFNNILSAIIGYTEIAMMDAADNPPQKRNLGKVLQAGERAKHLVQQILAFSRQKDPEPRPVQIRLIVSEALKLLRATLPATIDIHRRLTSDAAVMADPTQIHQVVMNLCTNAAQAMREKGGSLLLTLEEAVLDAGFVSRHPELAEGRYLRLGVEDTGPGIPAGIVDRVFDPFFTTKGKGEGTGLGLSVVHGIVASHGGMVTVANRAGGGAAFHVYLPVIQADEPAKTAAPSPLPTGREHILLVDDERFQADLGRQILERLGYTVTAFTDSREALERFHADPAGFDVVITDMTMPHVTGDRLAREMLALRPEMPIILCTGYSDRINEETAAKLGISGFLMKPIILKDIADLIRRVLDHRPPGAGSD